MFTKTFIGSSLFLSMALAHAAEFDAVANVISQTPINSYAQPTSYQQDCYNNQQQQQAAPTGGINTTALIGGVVGALAGSQVGKGSGKSAATAAGAALGYVTADAVANGAAPTENILGRVVGGAVGGVAGNQVGKGTGNTIATGVGAIGGVAAADALHNQSQPQNNNNQGCSNQSNQQVNQPTEYDIQYEYGGRVFTTRLRHQVGTTIPVRVIINPTIQ